MTSCVCMSLLVCWQSVLLNTRNHEWPLISQVFQLQGKFLWLFLFYYYYYHYYYFDWQFINSQSKLSMIFLSKFSVSDHNNSSKIICFWQYFLGNIAPKTYIFMFGRLQNNATLLCMNNTLINNTELRCDLK